MRPRDGYDALYREHHARILRLCRLLVNDAQEASDVTQDVFIAALKEWEAPEREMRWGPWLTRVAVNACHRRRRSRWWRWWRAAGEEFRAEDFGSELRTPEGGAIAAEQRVVILNVLGALSPRQREVFLLRHVEGYSTPEVADVLALDPGTVKQHLFRATTAFRKALGDVT